MGERETRFSVQTAAEVERIQEQFREDRIG